MRQHRLLGHTGFGDELKTNMMTNALSTAMASLFSLIKTQGLVLLKMLFLHPVALVLNTLKACMVFVLLSLGAQWAFNINLPYMHSLFSSLTPANLQWLITDAKEQALDDSSTASDKQHLVYEQALNPNGFKDFASSDSGYIFYPKLQGVQSQELYKLRSLFVNNPQLYHDPMMQDLFKIYAAKLYFQDLDLPKGASKTIALRNALPDIDPAIYLSPSDSTKSPELDLAELPNLKTESYDHSMQNFAYSRMLNSSFLADLIHEQRPPHTPKTMVAEPVGSVEHSILTPKLTAVAKHLGQSDTKSLQETPAIAPAPKELSALPNSHSQRDDTLSLNEPTQAANQELKYKPSSELNQSSLVDSNTYPDLLEHQERLAMLSSSKEPYNNVSACFALEEEEEEETQTKLQLQPQLPKSETEGHDDPSFNQHGITAIYGDTPTDYALILKAGVPFEVLKNAKDFSKVENIPWSYFDLEFEDPLANLSDDDLERFDIVREALDLLYEHLGHVSNHDFDLVFDLYAPKQVLLALKRNEQRQALLDKLAKSTSNPLPSHGIIGKSANSKTKDSKIPPNLTKLSPENINNPDKLATVTPTTNAKLESPASSSTKASARQANYLDLAKEASLQAPDMADGSDTTSTLASSDRALSFLSSSKPLEYPEATRTKGTLSSIPGSLVLNSTARTLVASNDLPYGASFRPLGIYALSEQSCFEEEEEEEELAQPPRDFKDSQQGSRALSSANALDLKATQPNLPVSFSDLTLSPSYHSKDHTAPDGETTSAVKTDKKGPSSQLLQSLSHLASYKHSPAKLTPFHKHNALKDKPQTQLDTPMPPSPAPSSLRESTSPTDSVLTVTEPTTQVLSKQEQQRRAMQALMLKAADKELTKLMAASYRPILQSNAQVNMTSNTSYQQDINSANTVNAPASYELMPSSGTGLKSKAPQAVTKPQGLNLTLQPQGTHEGVIAREELQIVPAPTLGQEIVNPVPAPVFSQESIQPVPAPVLDSSKSQAHTQLTNGNTQADTKTKSALSLNTQGLNLTLQPQGPHEGVIAREELQIVPAPVFNQECIQPVPAPVLDSAPMSTSASGRASRDIKALSLDSSFVAVSTEAANNNQATQGTGSRSESLLESQQPRPRSVTNASYEAQRLYESLESIKDNQFMSKDLEQVRQRAIHLTTLVQAPGDLLPECQKRTCSAQEIMALKEQAYGHAVRLKDMLDKELYMRALRLHANSDQGSAKLVAPAPHSQIHPLQESYSSLSSTHEAPLEPNPALAYNGSKTSVPQVQVNAAHNLESEDDRLLPDDYLTDSFTDDPQKVQRLYESLESIKDNPFMSKALEQVRQRAMQLTTFVHMPSDLLPECQKRSCSDQEVLELKEQYYGRAVILKSVLDKSLRTRARRASKRSAQPVLQGQAQPEALAQNAALLTAPKEVAINAPQQLLSYGTSADTASIEANSKSSKAALGSKRQMISSLADRERLASEMYDRHYDAEALGRPFLDAKDIKPALRHALHLPNLQEPTPSRDTTNQSDSCANSCAYEPTSARAYQASERSSNYVPAPPSSDQLGPSAAAPYTHEHELEIHSQPESPKNHSPQGLYTLEPDSLALTSIQVNDLAVPNAITSSTGTTSISPNTLGAVDITQSTGKTSSPVNLGRLNISTHTKVSLDDVSSLGAAKNNSHNSSSLTLVSKANQPHDRSHQSPRYENSARLNEKQGIAPVDNNPRTLTPHIDPLNSQVLQAQEQKFLSAHDNLPEGSRFNQNNESKLNSKQRHLQSLVAKLDNNEAALEQDRQRAWRLFKRNLKELKEHNLLTPKLSQYFSLTPEQVLNIVPLAIMTQIVKDKGTQERYSPEHIHHLRILAHFVQIPHQQSSFYKSPSPALITQYQNICHHYDFKASYDYAPWLIYQANSQS